MGSLNFFPSHIPEMIIHFQPTLHSVDVAAVDLIKLSVGGAYQGQSGIYEEF